MNGGRALMEEEGGGRFFGKFEWRIIRSPFSLFGSNIFFISFFRNNVVYLDVLDKEGNASCKEPMTPPLTTLMGRDEV